MVPHNKLDVTIFIGVSPLEIYRDIASEHMESNCKT
jgi:hypothetical protein